MCVWLQNEEVLVRVGVLAVDKANKQPCQPLASSYDSFRAKLHLPQGYKVRGRFFCSLD